MPRHQKRSYVKSSPYWSQPRKQPAIHVPATTSEAALSSAMHQAAFPDYEPEFDGKSHYTAVAACGGGNVSNSYRTSIAPASALDIDRYPNIRQGIMPFDLIENGNYAAWGATGAMALVYQAYFNFALLRNTINLLVDFSVSKIHIKTENARVKTFFETWFDSINLNQFMAQFFLEYYRSGNVFTYKFSGKMSEDGFNMLKRSYSELGKLDAEAVAKSKTIPIRYILLNPMQVYLQQGATYNYGWVRMLSTYEIARLKNPQTEEDKQVLRSFPPAIQEQIKKGGVWQYMFVPLDQNRLYYTFYRKQDYEPLAVPMAFPILNDIEFKMELRRIDMALVRQMEQVFLLVTAGMKADQWNQVPGVRQLQALQNIFQNQTIGRVLVGDYTVKAEWVIPDMKGLLGPEKYAQVDKDIREGLQFMFFGDEKFANASVKIKIFIESLREGRRAFMENFLMPEVKKICEAMRFKTVPKLEFEEIQIQDEALMARLYVQLAQLGLLTPEETFNAIKTGMLPNKEESVQHQEDYKKERGKDLYQPIAPKQEGAGANMNGRPAGSGGTPATRKVATPIGQSKAGASTIEHDPLAGLDDASRANAKYKFGITKVTQNAIKMNGLRAAVEAGLMKAHKLEVLDDAQQMIATTMAQSIVFNEPEDKWMKAVARYIKEPKNLPAALGPELDEIRAMFDTPTNPVDSWTASILARSKVEFTPSTTQ